MNPPHPTHASPYVILLLATGSLYAQVAPPDAGEIQREARTKAPAPPAPPRKDIVPPPSPPRPGAPEALDGAVVVVRDVVLTGNTVFTDEQLKALIADRMGQSMNLEGMKVMIRRITDHYREHGYLFGRAMIPVQEFRDGILQVAVFEGKYDAIRVIGTPELVRDIEPYLADLQPGDLLETGKLERTMLIVDDIPGVWVAPSISPGSKPETSDLEVAVKMEKWWGGDVGLDTYGSRYTGYYRAHLSLYRNSLLTFGDRLSALAMVTDESMLLGSLNYELPVDGPGLRLQVGYEHTTYELGREYEALDASGLAKIWSAKLSYPLLRSQPSNITASIGVQHKDLEDDFLAVSAFQSKSSLSFPLALHFDYRDTLVTGAVTYGMVGVTFGHLNLDEPLLSTDAATARSDGSYGKVNLDVARIQSFGHDFNLFVRVAAQWANGNLDTSESLGIAGIEGVRAYPIGEGSGDTGWLGQVELRYAIDSFAPYVFYDIGSNEINDEPWDAASDRRRDISGAGVGVRYERGRWSGNLSIAYRIEGGPPEQDADADNYRVGFALNCTF